MPLGSPEGPTQPKWEITANSVDRAGDYAVQFSVTVSTDNLDAPEVPAIVQKFVDMIANSPDFNLARAARSSTYAESMTPTT